VGVLALGRRLGPLVLLLRVAVLVGRDQVLRVLARLVAPDGRLDLRRGGALLARPLDVLVDLGPVGGFNASAAPVLRDIRDPARADDNLFAASAFPLRGRAMGSRGSRLVRVATKQVLILWIME
jgi:hypothetical protein